MVSLAVNDPWVGVYVSAPMQSLSTPMETHKFKINFADIFCDTSGTVLFAISLMR